MEIGISISIDDTLRRIYALSALRTYMNSEEREIPMLTPDNRLALAGLVRDAFSQLMLNLIPHVAACSIPDDETEDLLAFDLLLEECVPATAVPALRRAIGNVLADSAMGAALADVDNSLSRAVLRVGRKRIGRNKKQLFKHVCAGYGRGVQIKRISAFVCIGCRKRRRLHQGASSERQTAINRGCGIGFNRTGSAGHQEN